MSKTLIKYKRNIDKIYERANVKCNEGDYVTALSSLLHEAEVNIKNYEACASIAHIYTELGLWRNATLKKCK